MKNESTSSKVGVQDRKMTKGELISYGLGGVAIQRRPAWSRHILE